MKRAWLNLRYTMPTRVAMFTAGFERLGFQCVNGLTENPGEHDVLFSWNRIGDADRIARLFSDRGNAVLIAENATWGNDFAGAHWYTLAGGYHNVAGKVPYRGPERWDALGIELGHWRYGGETVVLPSRGLGPAPYRMPADWERRQASRGRVRKHPGNRESVALERDLARASKVITWGSGAAVKALMLGIEVESHQPEWIGACEANDESRLEMLRRMSWAQSTFDEIRSGEAMSRLLED